MMTYLLHGCLLHDVSGPIGSYGAQLRRGCRVLHGESIGRMCRRLGISGLLAQRHIPRGTHDSGLTESGQRIAANSQGCDFFEQQEEGKRELYAEDFESPWRQKLGQFSGRQRLCDYWLFDTRAKMMSGQG